MAVRGRADLHTHTNASDGWPTPLQLVEHASRRAHLDVIAVTDHDTIQGAVRAAEHAARRSKLHVIVGEEVSSRDGHIIGLFLEKRVPPGLSAAATIHTIHEQGGIAIAAHPFWRTQRLVRKLGCSDAHIVDAVGRAFTEFPGKTPAALRKAIEAGTTRAGRRRYRAVGLVRYAAWGLNHQRYVAAV